jgi:hypothetical protein
MLKNLLFRAFLGLAAVSVVAIMPTPALAQKGAAAKKKAAAAAARKKAMEAKKAEAKAAAKEKAAAKVETATKKGKAKVAAKQKEIKEEAAAADEAAKKAEDEMHAKHMGQIERLDQIATATDNAELKTLVASLKEKEGKRHEGAMPKAEEAAK